MFTAARGIVTVFGAEAARSHWMNFQACPKGEREAPRREACAVYTSAAQIANRRARLPVTLMRRASARVCPWHAVIGTLLIYADEHHRIVTQRTLGDLVAKMLTAPAKPPTDPSEVSIVPRPAGWLVTRAVSPPLVSCLRKSLVLRSPHRYAARHAEKTPRQADRAD